MPRRFVLKQNYFFIASGTILKQNIAGDYFVSMPDSDWIMCKVRVGRMDISGRFVENNPDIFEEIKDEGN